jgi:hypothetical protein
MPHKCVVEMGLQHLRLSIYQDDFMCHMSFLFRNHLYRVFLIFLFILGIFNVIGILIFLFILGIFSHAVKSSLTGNLHDELIVRLNHSFKGGLFFAQLLNMFAQLLARVLQLCDLLA